MTAHAERLSATRASKTHRPVFVADCTLCASAEPCGMCAGTICRAGIWRAVDCQAERGLKELTSNRPENPSLDLPCRMVFAAGQLSIEVIGPQPEDEAAA